MPAAAAAFQIPPGIAIDAIEDGGMLYLPIMSISGLAVTVGEDNAKAAPQPKSESPTKSEPKQAPKEEAKPVAKKASKTYTEEELQAMDAKDIEKLCIKLGVEIPEEGKNTNKKLRTLILEWQEAGADEGGEDDDSPAVATKDVSKEVSAILKKLDEQELSEAQARKQLQSLSDHDVKAELIEVLDEFTNDDDASIDEYAVSIAELLATGKAQESDDSDEEESEDASEEPQGTAVTEDELEKGDRVAIWWNETDDVEAQWYYGNVKSVGRKGVVIAYDDDTEATYNTDECGDIIKLEE